MRAIERTMRSLRLARAAGAGLVTAVLLTSPGAGQASPLLYFVHTDHLNTPRMVTDGNGTAVWRWDQVEPFGTNAPDEDPDGNSVIFHMPFRFPGQYFDKETGLAHNVFRDYDPGTGRYIQSDPMGVIGIAGRYGIVDTRPLSALPINSVEMDDETVELIRRATAPQLSYLSDFNLYAYVNGNPIQFADPLGLFPVCGNERSRCLQACTATANAMRSSCSALPPNLRAACIAGAEAWRILCYIGCVTK